MKKLLVSSVLFLLMFFLAAQQDAQAQRRIDLAPNAGYGINVLNQVGDPGTLSLGAQLHFYLREARDDDDRKIFLVLNPGFDYYLFDIEGMSGFQLDGNVLLGFGRRTSLVSPYVGLGAALGIVSGSESTNPPLSDVTSGTGIGLNLIAGALFGQASPRIITQFRYTLGESDLHRKDNADPGSGLQFHGGLLFKLNKN